MKNWFDDSNPLAATTHELQKSTKQKRWWIFVVQRFFSRSETELHFLSYSCKARGIFYGNDKQYRTAGGSCESKRQRYLSYPLAAAKTHLWM